MMSSLGLKTEAKRIKNDYDENARNGLRIDGNGCTENDQKFSCQFTHHLTFV